MRHHSRPTPASRFLVSLLLLAAGAGGGAADAASTAAKPPNIVLLLADDQGWTGTSTAMDPAVAGAASDYYRTPNLDRLAGQGMRFAQAYSPHPNCSPTRMSLQTGKSPARLGATDIVDVVPGTPSFIAQFYDTAYVDKPLIMKLPIRDLPDGEVTLAELLEARRPAYVTAHFGKWHMNGGGPGRHGYDEHDGETTNLEGAQGMPDPKRTGALTARALGFLDARAKDERPFLLQVSYWAVHTPVQARPESIAAYEARARGAAHTSAAYAAMTEELDASVGAILDRLDALGLAGDTYVIYTSDNGGETMNGTTTNVPLAKSKTFVWEGGIRVPMIVRGPGIPPRAVNRTPVIGWDVFPTVAEWIGAAGDLPLAIDGGSLAPLLRGEAGEVRRPGGALVWFYPHYRNMKGVKPQAAIREGRHKLVVEYESGIGRLFDLETDIGEVRDLAAARPKLAARLQADLDRYLDAVGARRPPVNPDYDPAKDKGLAVERREQPGS